MIQIKDREVKAVRIEIAIDICTTFPNLFNKIYGKSRAQITDYESSAAEVLAGLCELEPCVKEILKFYSTSCQR